MTTDEMISQTRRLIQDGFGGGDLSILDELIAPDCIEHQRGNHSGLEGAREVARTLHGWMSDFSLTVEDVAVNGDIVWTRNRARGVNTGSVMGNPPTGQPVEVDVFDVCRWEDGLMVEHWGLADQLGLMLQIGALPARKPVETAAAV